MNFVVLNAGSGSQKISLYRLPERGPLPEVMDAGWKAGYSVTAPDRPPGRLLLKVFSRGQVHALGTIEEGTPAEERVRRVLELLWHREHGALAGPQEVDVACHRVVHGGDSFESAVRVDASVEQVIESFGNRAPLHNPLSLVGIRVARNVFPPDTPHFAVFDTAFHRTLPTAAATYPGPREWKARKIRRYGFHGTSFRWACRRAEQLLGRVGDPELRLILCHLGGGCSLCATVGGRSIDTTMGYTPLDGIAMSTRSGAVDPGILLHLLREGMSVDALEQLLNRSSGLAGLSGENGDTRLIRPKAEGGDAAAREALDVFVHRLRAGIGQMLASLGHRPHAIVFTDVIGETEPTIRAAACEAFRFLGLRLDAVKNAASPLDADIAADDSMVRVLVIESREAWQIARECHTLLHS